MPAPTSKATATLNKDLSLKTLTSGSGYIAKPNITITGGVCPAKSPNVTEVTIVEGRIVDIKIEGECTKAPTIVIEDPEVPATATTTKISTDNYTVNITNK